MTQDEKGRLFLQMKAERDAARGTLCLAKKKREKLVAVLAATQAALNGEAEWLRLNDGLRVSDNDRRIMDCPYPSEADVLDVLEEIQNAEKAIHDYEEFVR